MTREQMIAHLVLHGWYPVRPGDGRKHAGLRNDEREQAIGGVYGTDVRHTASIKYGRSQECAWDEVDDYRLRELFFTARHRL